MNAPSMNLIDPWTSIKVAEGLKRYCEENGIKNISERVGILNDKIETERVC